VTKIRPRSSRAVALSCADALLSCSGPGSGCHLWEPERRRDE